ncbi:MAG: IS3 family transposase [Candidatus Phytoplasma stylosanthis]|uniref:IS3 family transposase n=2 Tax=Candidatus Phytoplasma stylosanthis TaxID=2798314 RepID=UPI00293AB2AE|nr:IS3 family transposase [Candidatus Phytoplasma stylosanthis]MDV3168072.1 IS3 family transposase [Candidatus Phytoplasma stylosanthis]MDV3170690.1 IS3 family transposase [Candidatus Phytoplasma stylosanthis]MDV3173673.1 IS3 family transposase [Candidatus Phytoplasma stylosanthis]MDV3202679.1 IS3 family transposase [Candidatus Phytoplasma stylosanthis]
MKKISEKKESIKRKKEIELLQLVISYCSPNFRNLIFNLVKIYKKYFKINKILKLLKISRSSYYYWKTKNKIKHKKNKNYQKITKRIGKLCKKNKYSFGYRKIKNLYYENYKEIINGKKVLKIMSKNEWLMRYRKPFNKKIFYKKNIQSKFNLINLNFKSEKPLQKIYTDLTCFKTKNGNFWLSVIIDGFNNQILSSVMSLNPDLKLVKKTFQKLPKIKENCILHSDQGSVYQSIKFKKFLIKRGFLISVSRKAFPNDNAIIESYFGILKGYLKESSTPSYKENFITLKKKIKKFTFYYNKNWIFQKFNYKSPLQYLESQQLKINFQKIKDFS